MPSDVADLAARFGSAHVGSFEPWTAPPADLASLPVISPPSLAVAREVLAWAARDGQQILFAGAGEHLHLASDRPTPDCILSTRALTRVVEYEPEEMVIVAEAGVTLASLDALVAPHAQRLAPDPWRGRAATIGGAIAGGRSGLDRLRRGSWRDALLGARVVHWDGSTSQSGGKVVKNVAGYDLAKLQVGGRGALALLGEVNLRLVPRPAATALVVAAGTRMHAVETLLEIHRSALAPAALLLVAGVVLPATPLPAGGAACVVRFEGRPSTVRFQVDEMLRRFGGAAWPAEAAQVAWDALRQHAEPRPDTSLVRIATLPVDVSLALESLASGAWRLRSFVGQFGVGTSEAQVESLGAPAAQALAAELGRRGARVDVLHPRGVAVAGPVDPVRDELATRMRAAYGAPSVAGEVRE